MSHPVDHLSREEIREVAEGAAARANVFIAQARIERGNPLEVVLGHLLTAKGLGEAFGLDTMKLLEYISQFHAWKELHSKGES